MHRPTLQPLTLIFLIIALVYAFAETRFPTANQDDNVLMAKQFPEFVNGQFFSGGLQTLLFKHNWHANEFRTYPLSKLFQYGLYRAFGHSMIGYYVVMAMMSVATALTAAFVVMKATASQATAIAIAAACLLGPFMLFQTFHHASYIVLPLLATVGYFAVLNRFQVRRWRILGGVLCALVATTGEIGSLILLAVLGVFLARAVHARDYPLARTVFLQGVIVIALVAVQFAYYKYAIYTPVLETRFFDRSSMTLESVKFAVTGFVGILLTRIFSTDAFSVLGTDIRFDLLVVFGIGCAAIVAMAGILRSSVETRTSSIKPALLALLMFVASAVIYLLVAARAHVGNYPPRYLHVSGLLLVASICLLALCLPVMLRKLVLAGVVLVSAAAGMLTFGVKAPTIEAFNGAISKQVAFKKEEGGTQVNLVLASNGIFINPYLLEPATTPLSALWIMENHSPLYWGLPCRQDASI